MLRVPPRWMLNFSCEFEAANPHSLANSVICERVGCEISECKPEFDDTLRAKACEFICELNAAKYLLANCDCEFWCTKFALRSLFSTLFAMVLPLLGGVASPRRSEIAEALELFNNVGFSSVAALLPPLLEVFPRLFQALPLASFFLQKRPNRSRHSHFLCTLPRPRPRDGQLNKNTVFLQQKLASGLQNASGVAVFGDANNGPPRRPTSSRCCKDGKRTAEGREISDCR